MKFNLAIFCSALALLLFSGNPSFAQTGDWRQWGGPNRNFKSASTGLAATWPDGGPKRLWQRELGEGYSAISAEGDKLFTMYRKGDQEIVISLDAKNGKTLWEYAYDAPFSKEYDMSHGPGPHATPTISGDFVFTSGATGKLHCLDKKSGKLIWSHDLLKEFNGTLRPNGFSCSPLVYKNTVIMQVGGQGNAIMAFNVKDGAVAWHKQDFKNSTSSPQIIKVDGQEQLLVYMFSDIIGLDPNNGELLWNYSHPTDFGLNTSLPVWGEDNLLFMSSAYGGGSRVLRLSKKDGKTVPEEIWFHRLMRVHFGTAMRVGDVVYGSSGDTGLAPFTAVDVKTGKILWRDRSVARASFILAEGKFIIIDEDGSLILATPSPEGLKVNAKAELFTTMAWTAPTLVGTTLFARDRKYIMALDLK